MIYFLYGTKVAIFLLQVGKNSRSYLTDDVSTTYLWRLKKLWYEHVF